MTNTKPAPFTADAYADLWSQRLRWEAAEATALLESTTIVLREATVGPESGT